MNYTCTCPCRKRAPNDYVEVAGDTVPLAPKGNMSATSGHSFLSLMLFGSFLEVSLKKTHKMEKLKKEQISFSSCRLRIFF